MTLQVRMDGLDDLLAALQQIPKRATEKAVVRRALTKSAEPIRSLWAALAPFDPNDPGMHLRDSIIVAPKTVSREAQNIAAPGQVTIYVGPDKNLSRHHGIEMEFGTFKDKPQPSGRPAWEGGKDRAFDLLGFFMWSEIDGALTRIAKRAG